MRCRCGCRRYHKIKGKWLLHYCRMEPFCKLLIWCGPRRLEKWHCCSLSIPQLAKRFSRSKASVRLRLRRSRKRFRSARLAFSTYSLLGCASQPLSKYLQLSWQMGVVQPSTSGFITAVELGHHRKRVVKISTGSKQLDSILGGWALYQVKIHRSWDGSSGFQTMSISEVRSPFCVPM